jgi:hypothetical protein
MNKVASYALTGFLIGFVLTFVGCATYIGKTSHGEQGMWSTIGGVFIGGIFGIIGAIIGGYSQNTKISSSKQQENAISQIEKLNSLKNSGALTEEEFQIQKNKLLNDTADKGNM